MAEHDEPHPREPSSDDNAVRRFLIDQRTRNAAYLCSRHVVWLVGSQLMLSSWLIVWGVSHAIGPHMIAARVLGVGVSALGFVTATVWLTVVIGRRQLMTGRE